MELNCGFLFDCWSTFSGSRYNSARTYGVHLLLFLIVWLLSIISSAGNSGIEMRAVRSVISYNIKKRFWIFGTQLRFSLFDCWSTFSASSYNSDRTYGVHLLLILTVWLLSIISSAGNSVIEMRAVRNVISYLVTTSAMRVNRLGQKNDRETTPLFSETVKAGLSAGWIA